MNDPMDSAAEFCAAYGIEPVDLRDRVVAVSVLTQRSAVIAENTKELLGAVWKLLSDLEAGASDEVVLAGFEDASVAFAHAVLELYGDAVLLGLTRFNEIVERAHAARMSAVSGDAEYKPVRASGLVSLPMG